MSATMTDRPTAELEAEVTRITGELTELDFGAMSSKVEHLEWECTTGLSPRDLREGRALYARRKLDDEIKRRALKAERRAISEELELRLGPATDKDRLRGPMRRLVLALLAYEADEEADDETLFSELDRMTVFARGRSWSLREFYTTGRGQW